MKKDDLKARSYKAMAWDFFGLAGGQAMSFVIGIILARLLSPDDFGLVGISVAFISFSQVFVNFGFGSALIQNRDVTSLTYSSVFYVNLLSGIILTLGLYALAPSISYFYGSPLLTDIIRVLSVLFMLEALSLVQMSILRRELKFKSLTIRQLTAQAAGGIVGVVSAFNGLGLYSLVLFRVTSAIVSAAVLWRVSGWRPDMRFKLSEVKKLTSFSVYMFFSMFMYNGMRQLDVLVVGKVFSPATLGFYSRATNLKNLVTKYSSTSLTRVFFPVMSSLQNEQERFRQVYFKAISVVSMVTYCLAGLLFILGPEIILILYGKKWEPSVLIFQILVLSIANFSTNLLIVQAFLSQGQSRKDFHIGLLRNTVKLIPLGLVFYYRDLFVFTVAIVVVNYALTIFNIALVGKYTGLSSLRHARIVGKDVAIFAVAVSATYFLEPVTLTSRLALAAVFLVFYLAYQKLLAPQTFQLVMNTGKSGWIQIQQRRAKR